MELSIAVYVIVGFLIFLLLIGYSVRTWVFLRNFFKRKKKIHELHPSNTSFTINQGNESNKKE